MAEFLLIAIAIVAGLLLAFVFVKITDKQVEKELGIEKSKEKNCEVCMVVHKELYEKFKEMTKLEDKDVDVWFPNGKGSVRVRLKDRRELVLTFLSNQKWRLETTKMYLEGMKKR